MPTTEGLLMVVGDLSYVPTLKAREAEIKAILRAPKALDLTPLFELQKASLARVDQGSGQSKRAKGSATDVSYFLDDIARLWSGPLYVDIIQVTAPGDRLRWWNLLAALNALSPRPAELIPVLIADSGAIERQAAAAVAAVTRRAALRVSMQDARQHPSHVAGATTAMAHDMGLPVSAVDVVLDWADSLEQFTLDVLASDTIAVINSLNGKHGRLITSGTPNSATFQQVGDWHPTRREWWLWLRLAHAGFDVEYGDYALYPPATPVPAAPQYGHLRYSDDHILHVHRRPKPTTGGGLAGAFEACCKHLVAQPYWLGAAFSGADQRFSDIAVGADKESVPGKWRQLAAEHHFSLVTQQLSSPPAAPPPGTS